MATAETVAGWAAAGWAAAAVAAGWAMAAAAEVAGSGEVEAGLGSVVAAGSG